MTVEEDLRMLAAARAWLPPIDPNGLLALIADLSEDEAERLLDIAERTAGRLVDRELHDLLRDDDGDVTPGHLRIAEAVADLRLSAAQAQALRTLFGG